MCVFGRYRTLGRFDASWAGLPIAPSFHLDARDAVLGQAAPLAATAVPPPPGGTGDGNSSSSSTSGSSILGTAKDANDDDDAGARAFYRAQVLFDSGGVHARELARQLRAHVCMRLAHVADALGANGNNGGESGLGAAPAPPPVAPKSSRSGSNNRLSVSVVGGGGARSAAASLKEANEDAAATRAADALALVGARVAAQSQPGPGKASLAAAPVAGTAAADEAAAALPAAGGNTGPAAPTRAPENLGFQKAWILSSVAQQYL